jgi:hypothetical protein
MLSTLTAMDSATVHKKKTPSKSAQPATGVASGPNTGSASRSADSGNSKLAAARTATARRPARKATTWRNRQLAPTPDRYKEIQQALVTKGYLNSEEATGGWNQSSVDALKRFQTDQKIEASGKINSLSLIALGLGPKRDTASSKPAGEAAGTDR